MIVEIFVDMDGVLSDFYSRFKSLYKVIPEVDYNAETKKVYTGQFDKFVKDNHFETLDPMPDLVEGLEFLRKLHEQIPICILTSTAREEYLNELARQKRSWLRQHSIEFHPVFVPGKHMKCYYSKPNRLLIDDTPSNIEQWINGGGIGILHTSWEQTIKEYEITIRRYKSKSSEE